MAINGATTTSLLSWPINSSGFILASILLISCQCFEVSGEKDTLHIAPLFQLYGNSPTTGLKYALEMIDQVKELNLKLRAVMEKKTGAFYQAREHVSVTLARLVEEGEQYLKEIDQFGGSQQDKTSLILSAAQKVQESSAKDFEKEAHEFRELKEGLEIERDSLFREIKASNQLKDAMMEKMPFLVLADIAVLDIPEDSPTVEEMLKSSPPPLPSESKTNETRDMLNSYYAVYTDIDKILDNLRPYKDYKTEDWLQNEQLARQLLRPNVEKLGVCEKTLKVLSKKYKPLSIDEFLNDLNAYSIRTEQLKAQLGQQLSELSVQGKTYLLKIMEIRLKFSKLLKEIVDEFDEEIARTSDKDEL